MKNEKMDLKAEIYDIEVALSHETFLMEIMKDFGEYNSEASEGVDKMTYMLNILYEKHVKLTEKLDEFIPRLQKYI